VPAIQREAGEANRLFSRRKHNPLDRHIPTTISIVESFVYTVILCIALTLTASTSAQSSADPVTVTLAPAADSTAATETFFRPATLTVHNTTAHTIRAVLLAPAGGGPNIYWPCVVPASTRQTVNLPLPPFSHTQPYAVSLLPEESPHAAPLAVTETTIEWPVEHVRREFIQADYERAHWPADVKRNAITLLSLGLLALAATLLIRAPAWRVAAAVAVAAGLTIFAATYLHSQPDVREQRLPAVRGAGAGELTAISALRSTHWATDRPLVPAYQTMAEFRADESVVHPGRAISLPLHAGQTRLFTQASPEK